MTKFRQNVKLMVTAFLVKKPFVTTACLYLLFLYMYCVDRIYFLFFNVCSFPKNTGTNEEGENIRKSLFLSNCKDFSLFDTKKILPHSNSVLLKNLQKGSAIQ